MTATDDRAHGADTDHPQWKWLPHLNPANADIPEWTYLVHLDPPVAGHAGHYLGSAADLDRRLAQHGTSEGARLLEVQVKERGGTFRLVQFVVVQAHAGAPPVPPCPAPRGRCVVAFGGRPLGWHEVPPGFVEAAGSGSQAGRDLGGVTAGDAPHRAGACTLAEGPGDPVSAVAHGDQRADPEPGARHGHRPGRC